jgi:hypothetical protein
VVGDIHGQLPDLIHILEDSGFPSETNKYIFNGDFVDRGPRGVEVMCLLLALFSAFPRGKKMMMMIMIVMMMIMIVRAMMVMMMMMMTQH